MLGGNCNLPHGAWPGQERLVSAGFAHVVSQCPSVYYVVSINSKAVDHEPLQCGVNDSQSKAALLCLLHCIVSSEHYAARRSSPSDDSRLNE